MKAVVVRQPWARAMLRLVEPSSGRIVYNDADITQLPRQELKDLRKEVQLIFQESKFLNPRLTIGDAIAEPMMIRGIERNNRERKNKVAGLLEQVSFSHWQR